MYESGSARISELQSALLRTQQQISANRRMLSPADDPIAAARALEVTQSQSLNTQYATNRLYASNSLSLEENALHSVISLLQDAHTQVVAAGNAAYDNTQRKYIATDLRGRLEELVGLANTRDSEGNYLFSGFQTAKQPFSTLASGVQYDGDQGKRNLQVGTGRQMSISDSGDTVFNHIAANKMFDSAASVSNAGTATTSALSIVNPAQLTGHNYDVVFGVTLGVTTYSIKDLTLGTILSSGNAYTSTQPISFDGLQMTITDTGGVSPADMDVFSVRPASASATDAVMVQTGAQSIFETLEDLITLLDTPSSNNFSLANGLAIANSNLSSALDNVLTVRASVGSRLKELETLDNAGSDRDIQYAATLSDLQDLDYVKAISDLTMQKTTLEAAQQSYVKIMNLSLFNYL